MTGHCEAEGEGVGRGGRQGSQSDVLDTWRDRRSTVVAVASLVVALRVSDTAMLGVTAQASLCQVRGSD